MNAIITELITGHWTDADGLSRGLRAAFSSAGSHQATSLKSFPKTVWLKKFWSRMHIPN